MNKNRFIQKHWLKLLLFIITIGLLYSSLFFINVGMVNAKWNTQSDIEGYQINNATGKLRETLYIHIDNSSIYAQPIRFVLSQKLAVHTTSVKLMYEFNETSELTNASFLGIHITTDSHHYYPWNTETKYDIFYYYSDLGNTQYFSGFKTATSLYDNPVVFFNSSDGDQLLRIGDITVEGSFNGFFSKPKVTEMTIDHIAELIYNTLLNEHVWI